MELWPDTQSELAIPIKYQDEILGVLNLESPERAAFSRQTLDKLDPLVAVAAAMLHQARRVSELVESEKEDAIQWIVAKVAHQLKAELYMVESVFLKIKDNPDSTRTNALLETAERSVNRVNFVVNSLVEFVRSGFASREMTPCNLSHVVPDVVGSVEQILQRNKTRVSMNLRSDVPPVEANEEGLKTVFLNTITNAIQAMPDGGTLAIETRAKQENNSVDVIIETAMKADREHRAELEDAQKRFYDVEVPDTLAQACVELATEFQAEGHRGDYIMALGARAYAALSNDDAVTIEHLKTVAPLALQHRRPGFLDGDWASWRDEDDERVTNILAGK